MKIRSEGHAAALAALVGAALLAVHPARAQERPASDRDRAGILYDILVNDGRRGELPGVVDNLAWIAAYHDQADDPFGATFQPVGDALRAQLGLREGEGLLVASLLGDGPSAQAGLKQHDILISLDGKSVASAEDLAKQLKAAGDGDVALSVLRDGKPLKFKVRPRYRVTFGPAEEKKTEYFIGVSISPADDALRAQLGLSGSQGVVVTEVVKDSPAEKVGIKVHDVVLEIGGKAIDSAEAMTAQVQAAKDQPTPLKLLRAGKPMTLTVAPAVRQVPTAFKHSAFHFYPGQSHVWHQLTNPYGNLQGGQNAPAWMPVREPRLDARIDRLDAELKALREAVEKLTQSLKKP
jgi:membrane-associated protease RseP (regulator of RpoE activity)